MTTIRELIEFLEGFPEETEVEVAVSNLYGDGTAEIDLEMPEEADIALMHSGHATSTKHFQYVAPEKEWTYHPTEEAKTRGMVEQTWPASPGTLTIGRII